ncbi:unnamed protein product [Linum trigynum]|uniref:Uncharacterized protein n=1 Tax=Linum trigynum TaxID=586398 RepID=A0AAV2DJA0_9ROSI
MEQGDNSLRKGPWLEEEDEQLARLVNVFGERKWDSIAIISGLRRSGKSCRMRWLNYLRPNLKRGPISPEEEQIIVQLHDRWGNKWSRIARSLPGRTDNEIKNYWRSHLSKKATQSQEEGNFHCNSNASHNTELDFPYQTENPSNSCNLAYCDIAQNDGMMVGPDQYDLWSLVESPYETRLYDHWMFEISSGEQGEPKFGGGGCHNGWNYSEVGESCMLGSLWDMS